MPRILAGVFAVLVCVFLSAPGEPSGRVVDLNEPGVLEALQGSNPVHYGKIRRILEDVLKYPDGLRPPSCGKETWRILPVGEVHHQHAACQGGHRRNTPWRRVSASQSERMSLSLSH